MVVAVFKFSSFLPPQIVYNKEEDELIQESNVLEPPNRARRSSLASVGSEMSSTPDIMEDSPMNSEATLDFGH